MYSKLEYIRGVWAKKKYRKIPGDCQWFCFQFRQPGLPNPSFYLGPDYHRPFIEILVRAVQSMYDLQ